MHSGLEKTVTFLGEVNSLDPVYAMADIFMLSSRLDPFPNVTIDAMLAGLPVVCFKDASGVAELLSNHVDLKRLVVPYADPSSAAEVIEQLSTDILISRRQKPLSAIWRCLHSTWIATSRTSNGWLKGPASSGRSRKKIWRLSAKATLLLRSMLPLRDPVRAQTDAQQTIRPRERRLWGSPLPLSRFPPGDLPQCPSRVE